MVTLERLQRLESECNELREQLRALTAEQERLKVKEQQSEFARIKAEEELKRHKEEAVQRQIQIRWLEEINEDNKRLQDKLSELCKEYEDFKVKAALELEEAKVQVPKEPQMSPLKEQELQGTILRLNSEMHQLKNQCQEMQSELQKDAPSQSQTNQFRSLYSSLNRARNLIFLICDILHLVKRSSIAEEEEPLQGSLIGKRQRLDNQ